MKAAASEELRWEIVVEACVGLLNPKFAFKN